MRKTEIILGLVLFCSVSTTAQNKIGYSYDASGNRIERTIILQAAREARQSSEIESSLTDNIDSRNIRIYPNPTQGQLRVDISSLGSEDICTLSVYTAGGQLILSDPKAGVSNNIDISSQVSGLYLLKITINENSSTWKIIKK